MTLQHEWPHDPANWQSAAKFFDYVYALRSQILHAGECLSLARPVFVHASLLKEGIEWLHAASARTGVVEWRDASELATRIAESHAVN